jgi:hypothetical protein
LFHNFFDFSDFPKKEQPEFTKITAPVLTKPSLPATAGMSPLTRLEYMLWKSPGMKRFPIQSKPLKEQGRTFSLQKKYNSRAFVNFDPILNENLPFYYEKIYPFFIRHFFSCL